MPLGFGLEMVLFSFVGPTLVSFLFNLLSVSFHDFPSKWYQSYSLCWWPTQKSINWFLYWKSSLQRLEESFFCKMCKRQYKWGSFV